jgi:hypothetical protein
LNEKPSGNLTRPQAGQVKADRYECGTRIDVNEIISLTLAEPQLADLPKATAVSVLVNSVSVRILPKVPIALLPLRAREIIPVVP